MILKERVRSNNCVWCNQLISLFSLSIDAELHNNEQQNSSVNATAARDVEAKLSQALQTAKMLEGTLKDKQVMPIDYFEF